MKKRVDGWPGTSVHGGRDASVDTSVAALTVKARITPCTREKEKERALGAGRREGKMRVG